MLNSLVRWWLQKKNWVLLSTFYGRVIKILKFVGIVIDKTFKEILLRSQFFEPWSQPGVLHLKQI